MMRVIVQFISSKLEPNNDGARFAFGIKFLE
jgi:hypothetical protein